jgi:hypothetical protein
LARQLPSGLVLMPMTTDFAVACSWMLEHTGAGVEGVVVKHLAHTYRSGGVRPCFKIRTRLTAEAVVGRRPRPARCACRPRAHYEPCLVRKFSRSHA